jgi:hypothetical protein
MSGQLSQGAVIVIVIVAAGMSVLLGYAIHAAFNRGRVNPNESAFTRNDDQDRYMRELREKRFAGIRMDERWPHRPKKAYSREIEVGTESPEF